MRNDPPKGVATPKSRRGFKGFWIDVYRELKKVEWPKPKEVNRLTGVVLVVCAIVVAVLSAMSSVFGTIVNLLQGK